MNFFEHQHQTRRQTRWLVVLFLLAVLCVIVAVDFVLLLAFGYLQQEPGEPLLSAARLQANASLLSGGAAVTACAIGLASLFKTLSLRAGGGQVALQLGGTLLDPDTRDPLRRRLANVVEEIALASGVPVPDIYVLEREAGINAFAAGYTPADAAIAVTRGTLEKLDRNELQGVIAHEFSHILNGDMRLNIRLMGVLFGILVLAMAGRRVLMHSHHFGRSRDKGGAGILLLAFGLLLIGWLGQFFGRWIKAAVSRQREYLADASAVQFTRDPDGIAGALKKIAVHSDRSSLTVDTEEVGHMLFALGRASSLFATHPPLLERISRIEPGFRAEDLQDVARRIDREDALRVAAANTEARAAQPRRPAFDPADILARIGLPGAEELLAAAALTEGLPKAGLHAVRAPEQAPVALLWLLLHADAESRERQLLAIAQGLGTSLEQQVHNLSGAAGIPTAEQRLPLLEIALPSLHRHPPEFLQKLLSVIDTVVQVDGKIGVFEFLVARLIRQYIQESANPSIAGQPGSGSLQQLQAEAATLLAGLASQGHPGNREAARAAWAAGISLLPVAGSTGPEWPDDSASSHDIAAFDQALTRLDELRWPDRQQLLAAMIATVTFDGRLVPEELELLRAASAALHVPLPVLAVSA